MNKDQAVEKREIELREQRTFAYIYRRTDGGPFRNLITGRSRIPVGKTPCIKADMRSVPWQGMLCEKRMVELCEVAPPVHRLMTQPHLLEMVVTGESRRWKYFPDMALEVDAGFANMIQEGVPFAQAVADWRPSSSKAHTVAMIVEIKDDNDRRNADPRYALKLDLARTVYDRIGWRFHIAIRSRDIDAPMMDRAIRAVMLDHDTSITPGDIDTVRAALPARSYPGTLRDVANAFGGGARGRSIAAALHVRRIIAIDLTHDMRPETPVRLLEDGGINFERQGAYPW